MIYCLRCFILTVVYVLSLTVSVYGKDNILTDGDKARYESISKVSNEQLYDTANTFLQSDMDSALMYFDILSRRYRPEMNREDALLCSKAMLHAGRILYDNSGYGSAMEIFLKCRKICEDNGFDEVLSETYRYIGNIYSTYGDFERALSFYEQSLAIAQSIRDSSLMHLTLNNLVGANLFSGNLEKAEEYYDHMVKNRCDDSMYCYDILVDGALINLYSENDVKALAMLKEAAEYVATEKFDVTKTGTINSWIAQIYSNINKPDSMLHYLHENESLARKTNRQDLLAETLRGLSEAYKIVGNRSRSVEYLEEYLKIHEQVFNQKSFNTLKNAQFQYELDKSDGIIRDLSNERLRQQMRIEKQRAVLWVISVGLLLVGIFLMIIHRQKRRISKAYKDLFEHNLTILENEKIYRSRIRELEDRLTRSKSLRQDSNNEDVSPNSIPEDTNGSRASVAGDMSKELRERLQSEISKIMDNPETFCDPSFTINRLAEVINSNTTYVSKVINDTYGMNFRTFLSQYRIKEAMLRLGNTREYSNFTIKAIGESVGFKSPSAFISAFTKFTGMKPSIYQEIARQHNV